MIYKLRNITLHVEKDYDTLSAKAGEIICNQIKLKKDSVLGLATGSTPIGTYKYLAQKCQNKEVTFSDIVTFNLDEYYPMTRDNEQSYYYFMKNNLFDHIDIKDGNYNLPDGNATDVIAECKRYDELIVKANEIDLQILGIGNNGHIAFIEPDEIIEGNTHYTKLSSDTINANSRLFDSIDDVPKMAITTGIKNIMLSKHVLLLANGLNKANAIKKALFEPITSKVPASVLQLHPKVDIIITEDIYDSIKDLLEENN